MTRRIKLSPKRSWQVVAGWLVRIGAVVLLLGANSAFSASTDDLEMLLELDPYRPLPPQGVTTIEQLQRVWLVALDAPEMDLQRRAAEAIRRANRLGVLGLEATVPHLIRLARGEETHPQVRLACLRALAELDDPSASAALMEATDLGEIDVAATVEPALARWDHPPIREVWLRRLENSDTLRRKLLLALDGLGTVREVRAESALRQLVESDGHPPEVRLRAARALARLPWEGLVELARELAVGDPQPSVLPRLLGATLLGEHQDMAAQELLESLSLDPEPAVADTALARLIELAPDKVRELAPQLLSHADANLRRWAIQAVGEVANPPHLEMLSERLNDPHPQLRVMARNFLLEFAEQHDLREEVIASAMQWLGESDWRGLEQAGRIVARLDHKPAAGRLAELLPHDRDEVAVTAAWGLRVLNVSETLAPAFAYARQMADRVQRRELRGGPLPEDLDGRLAHLLQFFGVQKYEEADSLLRSFFPKEIPLMETRASAVWAMGHLYADDPPDDLANYFIERIQDVAGNPPEFVPVRQQAAIALGRMKYEAALPVLREFYEMETSNSPVGHGAGWAIEQITGEPVTDPVPEYRQFQDWFLSPVGR